MSAWSGKIEKRARALGFVVEKDDSNRFYLIENKTGYVKLAFPSMRQVEAALTRIRAEKEAVAEATATLKPTPWTDGEVY